MTQRVSRSLTCSVLAKASSNRQSSKVGILIKARELQLMAVVPQRAYFIQTWAALKILTKLHSSDTLCETPQLRPCSY
jgi:hypothetical protein